MSPEAYDVQGIYSFSKAILIEGHQLMTKVIEKTIRIPYESDEEVVWSHMEKRAQASLGLKPEEPFLVIVRLKKLDDATTNAPKYALSRVYLNPSHFPDNFLDSHDFSQESLAHIYREHGYEVTRINTVLQARSPNLYERVDLKVCGYDIQPFHPVLHAEQELFAKVGQQEEFHLEFLQATYVNWPYAIENRPL